MATPARPAPSVSGILEQLDELEALMRRMLTVPVEPGEEETSPPKVPPATAPEARASAKSNSPSVQEPAVVHEEPRVVTPPLREPVRISTSPAPRAQPAETAKPRVTASWLAGTARTEPALKPTMAAAPRPGILRRGLQRVDATFHAFTRPWGPFGRWLDDDPGRATLGMLGILLVLGACSWGAWDWWSARDAHIPRPGKPRPEESRAIN